MRYTVRVNYVPTPEEIIAFQQSKSAQARKESIQEYLANKEGITLPKPTDPGHSRQMTVVGSISERIEGLEKEVKRKKRSQKELSEAMFLLMEKYDFSPAEELMKIATEKRPDGKFRVDMIGAVEDPRIRIGILETLLEYTAPKLKSVEMSGLVEHEHTINIIRIGDDGVVRKEPMKLKANDSKALQDAYVDITEKAANG